MNSEPFKIKPPMLNTKPAVTVTNCPTPWIIVPLEKLIVA
jgi:hypothetical protein